jgi:hypothetical protein
LRGQRTWADFFFELLLFSFFSVLDKSMEDFSESKWRSTTNQESYSKYFCFGMKEHLIISCIVKKMSVVKFNLNIKISSWIFVPLPDSRWLNISTHFLLNLIYINRHRGRFKKNSTHKISTCNSQARSISLLLSLSLSFFLQTLKSTLNQSKMFPTPFLVFSCLLSCFLEFYLVLSSFLKYSLVFFFVFFFVCVRFLVFFTCDTLTSLITPSSHLNKVTSTCTICKIQVHIMPSVSS